MLYTNVFSLSEREEWIKERMDQGERVSDELKEKLEVKENDCVKDKAIIVRIMKSTRANFFKIFSLTDFF